MLEQVADACTHARGDSAQEEVVAAFEELMRLHMRLLAYSRGRRSEKAATARCRHNALGLPVLMAEDTSHGHWPGRRKAPMSADQLQAQHIDRCLRIKRSVHKAGRGL